MARQTYAPKQTYVGSGSLATYSFDFKIEALTQLLVVVVNVLGVEVERVRGDDVTFLSSVTFSQSGGGSVTLLANLPAGYTMVLLEANDAPTQPFEFADKTSFNMKVIERAYDFLAGAVQRLSFRASQAFRIHDADDEETFNPQLPPGISLPANYNRTFAISPDGTKMVYGPTTDTIDGAVGAAAAAAASAADASASASASDASADSAAISEANTTFYANLFLFDDFIQVDDTDSPVGPLANGSLYLADDTAGSIDFELPDISLVDTNYKIAVIKQSNSVNQLNVIPDGADTILGLPAFASTQQGIGCVFFKISPTNWSVRYFAFTESTGLNPLPIGGDLGAALVKTDPADFVVGWENFIYEGFSSRFNQSVSLAGLKDVLDYILAITYLGPLIASFSGSSNTLREKGTSVSGITLSVNVTKRSNLIAQIVFKQSGTTFQTFAPPAQTGSGVTASSNAVTPFTDNMTFSVEVTDAVVGPDGGNTVTSSTTYSFVYPYYYGAAVPGRTPAQVAALTKSIITENTNYNRPFTTANGDVYYFAYPASYGNLVSILDENGFETFSSWTKTTANITGLDASAVSYNIYEFNNPVVAGSTNFTFKQ